MKRIILPLLMGSLAILAGCSTAGPQNIAGNYYMTGDSECKRFRLATSDSILCYDKDNNYTGRRYAMTGQDIQMYQYERSRIDAMNRAAMQNTIQRPVQCVTSMGITTCY